MKLHDSMSSVRAKYTAKILALILNQPTLSYAAVAQKTGGSLRTVTRIAAKAGIRRQRGRKKKSNAPI